MREGSRKLVAIMFTDIAGYTRMMGEDEGRAVAALARSREVVRAHVFERGGEILDEVGDGSLSNFDSAVEAVDCARAIQLAIADDPDLELRIGIHIGDVLVSREGVVGDGVNVASRIHGLADPGAICISERVYDHVRNRPDLRARRLGPQALKNVDRRITVYVVGAEKGTAVSRDSAQQRRRRWRAVAMAVGLLAVLGMALAMTGPGQRLVVNAMIRIPLLLAGEVEQTFGFATARDGTRIAYATTGEGPAVIRVLPWFTHVEHGMDSPAYNPSVARLAQDHLYVRYDGRGSGLSDRDATDYSLDALVGDLEAVVDALGLERFALYAISAGGPVAINYAAAHPERVSHLILVSSLAGKGGANPVWTSIGDMMRSGAWDGASPASQQMLASIIIPDATPVSQRVLTQMLRSAIRGKDAAAVLATIGAVDTRPLLAGIRTPTLVVHTRGDLAVPLESGRELAAGIPGARLMILESVNHGLPANDPESDRAMGAILSFMAAEPQPPVR
jgi:class 3 adenylate cyclase/pimeloyl-ACP methyl ester carboxylesterase